MWLGSMRLGSTSPPQGMRQVSPDARRRRFAPAGSRALLTVGVMFPERPHAPDGSGVAPVSAKRCPCEKPEKRVRSCHTLPSQKIFRQRIFCHTQRCRSSKRPSRQLTLPARRLNERSRSSLDPLVVGTPRSSNTSWAKSPRSSQPHAARGPWHTSQNSRRVGLMRAAAAPSAALQPCRLQRGSSRPRRGQRLEQQGAQAPHPRGLQPGSKACNELLRTAGLEVLCAVACRSVSRGLTSHQWWHRWAARATPLESQQDFSGEPLSRDGAKPSDHGAKPSDHAAKPAAAVEPNAAAEPARRSVAKARCGSPNCG